MQIRRLTTLSQGRNKPNPSITTVINKVVLATIPPLRGKGNPLKTRLPLDENEFTRHNLNLAQKKNK